MPATVFDLVPRFFKGMDCGGFACPECWVREQVLVSVGALLIDAEERQGLEKRNKPSSSLATPSGPMDCERSVMDISDFVHLEKMTVETLEIAHPISHLPHTSYMLVLLFDN